MIYSHLGKMEDKVSKLGFGCMRFPTKDEKIDKALSLEMIDRAYKGGVNYFDTAYGYHGGESELFVSEALGRYPRDSFYLADKLPIWLLKTADDVPRYLDEQLKKCGVEYFDYYLLHSLNKNYWPNVKEVGAYEQLKQKKEAGVIRNLGFSYHGDFDTFCEIVDTYEWDFVQIQINYLDDSMIDAKAFHDKLSAKGIPCIVMEPVRGGFLANLPESARKEQEAVNDDSAASWALRWCMDRDNMPVILSGMSTIEQVEENLEVFARHRPLTPEENAALARTVEVILTIKTIPCTACGYCMDCSFGVNIPEAFRIYNDFKLFNGPYRANQDYTELGPERNAGACTKCGACSPRCPQGIDIPARLVEVHEVLSNIKLG